MTALASAPAAEPSSPVEGHSQSEPGILAETCPHGPQQIRLQQDQNQPQYVYQQHPQQQQQQQQPSSQLSHLARGVVPLQAQRGNGREVFAAAVKSAEAAKEPISTVSSCFSFFNPLRGLCGRALAYLTAQAVVLAVVNGTIISFTSPLTAVPVICAVVDEFWARTNPGTQSIVLESVVTAMVAASSFAMLKPFKEHMGKVIPISLKAPDSISGIPEAEVVDYSTAVHLAAGVAVYLGYRVNHATNRALYRE